MVVGSLIEGLKLHLSSIRDEVREEFMQLHLL